MPSLTTFAVTCALLTMGRDARPDQSLGSAVRPECVARYQRCVDDGLSATEIDSIESETRQHSLEPVIAITFARRKRSALVDHAVVEVKVLSHCDEISAGGRYFYFRRLKSGWRLDPKRNGRWKSVTDIVQPGT